MDSSDDSSLSSEGGGGGGDREDQGDLRQISLSEVFSSVAERYMYENEDTNFSRTVYSLFQTYRATLNDQRHTTNTQLTKKIRRIAWVLLNPHTLAFERECAEKKLREYSHKIPLLLESHS